MSGSVSLRESEQEVISSIYKEEDLVLMAQKGNEQAMEVVVNRYKGFVKARTQAYFLIGAEREDVIQEGMIGLYKAIRSYNAEKNASFKTFAELCIVRRILSAVKMATRQKHMPLNSYISLHKSDSETDYIEHMGYSGEKSGADPEQIMIEKEDMQGIGSQIDKVLSEFEAKVLMYHLNGVSYGKIAGLMGKEPKSIDNALQRMKKKLEKFLLEKKSQT